MISFCQTIPNYLFRLLNWILGLLFQNWFGRFFLNFLSYLLDVILHCVSQICGWFCSRESHFGFARRSCKTCQIKIYILHSLLFYFLFLFDFWLLFWAIFLFLIGLINFKKSLLVYLSIWLIFLVLVFGTFSLRYIFTILTLRDLNIVEYLLQTFLTFKLFLQLLFTSTYQLFSAFDKAWTLVSSLLKKISVPKMNHNFVRMLQLSRHKSNVTKRYHYRVYWFFRNFNQIIAEFVIIFKIFFTFCNFIIDLLDLSCKHIFSKLFCFL